MVGGPTSSILAFVGLKRWGTLGAWLGELSKAEVLGWRMWEWGRGLLCRRWSGVVRWAGLEGSARPQRSGRNRRAILQVGFPGWVSKGACACGRWKIVFLPVAIASQFCRKGPRELELGQAQLFFEEFGPAYVLQARIRQWSRGRTIEEGQWWASLVVGLEKVVGGRVGREAV